MTQAATMTEQVARALCEASGAMWKEGTYEVASGPNFEMEDHPLDPLNNHWRHMARAAIAALQGSAALPSEAMIEAGEAAVDKLMRENQNRRVELKEQLGVIYTAMLGASRPNQATKGDGQ